METGIKLVRASDYYQALLADMSKAEKRIVIHAMNLLWGPRTEAIVPVLHDALSRGVQVRIVGDYYSKFQANRPKLIRVSTLPKWAYTRAINYRLEAAGASITYVGKIGINPFKGRCHSKFTLIDNLVYSFGGINFSDDSFDNHDYMLKTQNQVLADRLYDIVRDIEADKSFPDIKEPLSKVHTLLFDGGNPGASIIYETACQVVANAKKVYYISQMCPSGELAKYIAATDNYCYFVRPSQAEPPGNLAQLFDSARHRDITNRYKGKQYIHAKFMLCEGKDGTHHVISGSNNFSWRGIVYGTKEIALHSTDPALWQTFYKYVQEIIT